MSGNRTSDNARGPTFGDTDAATIATLAIASSRLSKHFGRQAAVAGIDLAVPRGAVFGFLGPNGSGKTTTIRLLLGLAAATSGRMWLLGQEVPGSLRTVLPRVGALIEGPAFYPFLSGADNLARLDAADPDADASTRRQRIAVALDRVGLTHAANKRAKAYSLGMKQRLGIANALLRPRELLVLDEPTNGLDPQGTREVRSLLKSLAAAGTTVFVSSHLLSEVQQICTHAAIMTTGRIVAQGTLEELRGSGGAGVVVRTADPQLAADVLAGLGMPTVVGPGGWDAGAGETTIVNAGLRSGILAEDVVAALVGAGVRVRGFELSCASLEDRFVELTGEGFDVAG